MSRRDAVASRGARGLPCAVHAGASGHSGPLYTLDSLYRLQTENEGMAFSATSRSAEVAVFGAYGRTVCPDTPKQCAGGCVL